MPSRRPWGGASPTSGSSRTARSTPRPSAWPAWGCWPRSASTPAAGGAATGSRPRAGRPCRPGSPSPPPSRPSCAALACSSCSSPSTPAPGTSPSWPRARPSSTARRWTTPARSSPGSRPAATSPASWPWPSSWATPYGSWATTGSGSAERSPSRQLPPKLLGAGEADGVDTEGAGRGHVGLGVVDVEGRLGGEPEPVEQEPEERRVGLDHPLLAGDEHPVEPGQELEALAGDHEGLGRPVGEGVQRHPGGPQLGPALPRATDGAAQHLGPALGVGGDGGGVGRVALDQLGHALGERPAAVLLGVPLRGADGGQELLHRGLIGQQL